MSGTNRAGAPRAGSPGSGVRQRTVLPVNSRDSEDSPSSKRGHGLKAPSFDDCYSLSTPGYHDAFALLARAERGEDNNQRDQIENEKKIDGEIKSLSTAALFWCLALPPPTLLDRLSKETSKAW